MGWVTQNNWRSREDVIQYRTGHQKEVSKTDTFYERTWVCLAKSWRSGVLWSVWKYTRTDITTGKLMAEDCYIQRDLIKAFKESGETVYGYKDMGTRLWWKWKWINRFTTAVLLRTWIWLRF